MAAGSQRKGNKKSKRMSRMRRRRRQVLFGLVFVCVCIIFAISYGVLYRYVSKFPADKICDNIYIGSVNVSGMTDKEAKEALKKHLEDDRKENVTMKVDDKKAAATLEELGLHYNDIDKVTKKAVSYGKKGRLWVRYRQLRKLSKEKMVLGEEFVLDHKKSKAVIEDRVVPLASHAVDAKIKKDGDGFKITKEKDGQTVDIKASTAKLEKYLNEKWKHKDIAMKMTLIKESPSVTKKDLSTIKDELGAFSTDAGGGERWQNLKTGVDLLNGSVLMPGEQLSVHDRTAPYDEEHGYVPAGSYENGQVVDSFGGGICQVSTTLYNAVLYAELEVVERYPHSMLVAYVDPSRDAAIAGDYLDFVFKNSYDTPIFIAGEIDAANQLRFTIYGKETRTPGRTVEFESETLTTEDYGVTYKENSDAALGSLNYAGSPHTGKTAQLWKIVYQDGKQVSRDVINNSTYEKSDQIIEIGTKTDNAQAKVLVQNAIATQDKGKIDAAISQARSLQAQPSQGTGGQEQSSQESTGQVQPAQ